MSFTQQLTWFTQQSAALTQQSPAEVNTTGRCHLLELPRELRDEITEFALIYNRYAIWDLVQMYYGNANDFKQPALALVNSQLRTEALAVYYGQKIFFINSLNVDSEHWEMSKRLFKAIQSHLPMIKEIRLGLCDHHEITLQINAPPGKPPQCIVYHDFVGPEGSAHWVDSCRSGRAFNKRVKEALQDLCNKIGFAGFGVDDYIHAGNMFLENESNRCDPYNTDTGSEFDDDDSEEEADEDDKEEAVGEEDADTDEYDDEDDEENGSDRDGDDDEEERDDQ